MRASQAHQQIYENKHKETLRSITSNRTILLSFMNPEVHRFQSVIYCTLAPDGAAPCDGNPCKRPPVKHVVQPADATSWKAKQKQGR